MRSLLIVADDLATLIVMRTLFGRHGWQVAQCKTITDAISQLEPPPDWIVLDLGLADGDGEAVLRKVRDSGVPSCVAIICQELDEERSAALRLLRPDRVFQRPLRFEEFLKSCAEG